MKNKKYVVMIVIVAIIVGIFFVFKVANTTSIDGEKIKDVHVYLSRSTGIKEKRIDNEEANKLIEKINGLKMQKLSAKEERSEEGIKGWKHTL